MKFPVTADVIPDAAKRIDTGNTVPIILRSNEPIFPYKKRDPAGLLVDVDATRNTVTPVDVARVALALNADALAAGNVTAGRPLIEPMLNALLPALDVVFDPRPLLSSQTPVAMFAVRVESAPSNHKTHDGIDVGSDVVVGVSRPHFHPR
jgi:hypothetical protein